MVKGILDAGVHRIFCNRRSHCQSDNVLRFQRARVHGRICQPVSVVDGPDFLADLSLWRQNAGHRLRQELHLHHPTMDTVRFLRCVSLRSNWNLVVIGSWGRALRWNVHVVDALEVKPNAVIKDDWMIGDKNMVNERKGFWGRATWKGRPINSRWKIQPSLVGERGRVFGEAGNLVHWRHDRRGGSLCWWRTRFNPPKGKGPWALDLLGMAKGLAWLNGCCLGRYWLAPAIGWSLEYFKLAGVQDEGLGRPTQRYYHIPGEWLKDRNNLVLFEEAGGNPSGIRLCRRL